MGGIKLHISGRVHVEIFPSIYDPLCVLLYFDWTISFSVCAPPRGLLPQIHKIAEDKSSLQLKFEVCENHIDDKYMTSRTRPKGHASGQIRMYFVEPNCIVCASPIKRPACHHNLTLVNWASVTPLPIAAVDETPPVTVFKRLST
jgi:hypothetical protein